MAYFTGKRKYGQIASVAAAAHHGYRAYKKAKAGYDMARGIKAAITSKGKATAASKKLTYYRIPTTVKTKTLYKTKRFSRYKQKKYKRRLKLRRKLKSLLRDKFPVNTLIEKVTTTNAQQWVTTGTDLTVQLVLGSNEAYGCWTPSQISGLQGQLTKFQATSNGTVISSLAPNISFRMTYMRHRVDMKNISGANGLMVDVYTCTARQNIADTNYKDPKTTWTTLVNQDTFQPTGGANSISINTKTATPFDCPNFGRFWKINHVERLSFDNLETKTVTMKCKTGTFKMPQDMASLQAIKGLTMYWIFIVHPTLTNNSFTTSQNLLEIAPSRTLRFQPGYDCSWFPNNNMGISYRIGLTAPPNGA